MLLLRRVKIHKSYMNNCITIVPEAPSNMQSSFDIAYSNISSLNTLDVHIPRPGCEYDKNKIWIV